MTTLLPRCRIGNVLDRRPPYGSRCCLHECEGVLLHIFRRGIDSLPRATPPVIHESSAHSSRLASRTSISPAPEIDPYASARSRTHRNHRGLGLTSDQHKRITKKGSHDRRRAIDHLQCTSCGGLLAMLRFDQLPKFINSLGDVQRVDDTLALACAVVAIVLIATLCFRLTGD